MTKLNKEMYFLQTSSMISDQPINDAIILISRTSHQKEIFSELNRCLKLTIKVTTYTREPFVVDCLLSDGCPNEKVA